MPINKGYIYEGPFESKYSMFRRILAANPALNNEDFKQEYRLRYDSKEVVQNYNYRLSAGCNRAIQVARFTQRQHSIYDIKYYNDDSIRKQCPSCAKAMFHSPIYNFRWMVYCPLHDEALLTYCPICKARWPGIRDLHKTSCILCGIPETLRTAGIRDIGSNRLERLAEIYNILRHYSSLKIERVIPFDDFARISISSLDSKLLPSVAIHEGFIKKDKALSLGMDVVDCYRKNYKISKLLNFKYGSYYESDINSVRYFMYLKKVAVHINSVRRHVEKEILESIKNLRGKTHPRTNELILWGPNPCPCCLAYHYWKKLVNKIYEEKNPYFRDNHGSWALGLTCIPRPSTLILRDAVAGYVLDLKYQLDFYKLDLMYTYKCLYDWFEYLLPRCSVRNSLYNPLGVPFYKPGNKFWTLFDGYFVSLQDENTVRVYFESEACESCSIAKVTA